MLMGFGARRPALGFSYLLIATSSPYVYNTTLWYDALCVASAMEYAPSLLTIPSRLVGADTWLELIA
jgi:hypothetical protein